MIRTDEGNVMELEDFMRRGMKVQVAARSIETEYETGQRSMAGGCPTDYPGRLMPAGISVQFGGTGFILHAKAERRLRFPETVVKSKKLTRDWTVLCGDVELGYVAWFASWRRYTFQPLGGTVYDPSCLAEIAAFCHEQTELRKKARLKCL